MADSPEKNSASINRLKLADYIFLLFLVLAMAGVAWVGSLAYKEGMKTEATKRNGEAWVKWFTQAALDRNKSGYEPNACATGFLTVAMPTRPIEAVEPYSEAYVAPISETTLAAAPSLAASAPTPRTWGPCLKVLTAQNGPMSEYLNPFSQKAIVIVPKCDMADRSLAGSMSLEKTVPTPPGSAVPVISSPLTDSDSIESKMQIRVTMCDKGAYPIRIAELEF